MKKSVAIVQSNYIPWKGYFHLINSVDEFVLYDDAQYTRRDWRNRNRIKTPDGLKWLTIPVQVKDRYHQKVNETRISDKNWARKHWLSLQHYYSRAPQFRTYKNLFKSIYLKASELDLISEVNYMFILEINKLLNIQTPIKWSSDFELPEERSERLLQICLDCGATNYLSGPAAKDYLDESIFSQHNITVDWMDYSGFPKYPQLFGEFEHGVSILDLLFNVGEDYAQYLTPECK